MLFNSSIIYDRGIIAGIGNYLSSTLASWDLFLEEDFLYRLRGIERWQGDGIIADFDDPLIGGAAGGAFVSYTSGSICLALGVSTGIGGVVCAAALVGAGAWAGKTISGKAGEVSGEISYEKTLP